jgi:hypothetical protein
MAFEAIKPLGHALREFAQDTLENLELGFKLDKLEFPPFPRSLGSLHDFPQLKRISCPIANLLDEPMSSRFTAELRTVLPPSLTSLCLWIDREWAGGGWHVPLVHLLERKTETVPLLETLCIRGCINLGPLRRQFFFFILAKPRR